MGIYVIGKNGFLGQSLAIHRDWNFLSHTEALDNTSWVNRAHCVINCAFSPRLRTGPYQQTDDLDLLLARIIGANPCQYIMISSRAAYGLSPTPSADAPLSGWRESDPPHPHNDYARNKLQIEKSLSACLGNRLTILRLATIFGFEFGPEITRRSFFGLALTNLVEKKTITLDMHPDVRRDFYAVWRFAKALKVIADDPKPGLYNLGSGHGTRCGDIASWLIAGYGQGHIVHSTNHKDPFYLNMDKTYATWPTLPVTTIQDIREDVLHCGTELAKNPVGQ